MKKKYKNYIFLILAIILLTAACIIISGLKTDKEAETESNYIELYSLDSEKISEIKITNPQGGYTLLYNDKVTIKEIPDAEIDEEKARQLKSDICVLGTEKIIEDNADNLFSFGLDKSKYTAEIITEKGEKTTLYIGDKAPGENGFYGTTDENKRVFLVASYKAELLQRESSFYRMTSFFEINKETVSEIKLETPGKTPVLFSEIIVEDTKKAHNVFSKYQMKSPFDWPASGDMVGKIIDSVSDIKVTEYAAENLDNMSGFGFSPYSAKLTIIHDGGKSDTVLFGNASRGKIYIRVNDRIKIYGVSSEPFEFLKLEPFAYLSNFAFLRNIDTVKNIKYTHGSISSSFDLKKSGEDEYDIKKDGKLMSQDSFKNLYTELISISLSGPFTGETDKEPLLSYVFSYNDGTSETVQYFRIDDRRAAVAVKGKIQFYVSMVSLNERLEKIDKIINQ